MSNLTSIVKSIQNIMRQDSGVDGDAQRIGQLTWLFFLKIFDAHEEQLELLNDHYRSPLPDDLRWRAWAADPEGRTGDDLLDFVNNRLFPALKDLPGDATRNPCGFVIRSVFEDAFNYMKSGHLLRQVVNKINGVDFNRKADRHQFNDIYEKLLRDLQSAGNAGEFYTPRAVTQFMVDMVDPRLGQRVLDPACGTGGFLVCALEHLRKQVRSTVDEGVLQTSIFGVEKKQLPHLLCVTNMLLHGIDVPIGTQLIAKGLRPSRINILKWYMDNGQRADISFDQDQLRAMTLPTFDAVIQYNGIVLKYEDSNRRIRELRFFSERLRSDPRYQKAAATRRVVKVRVKFDPQNLSELWLPSTKEVIRCRNKSADDFLILHGTLSDLTQHREAESDYRAEHQQERDQAEAKKTLRRDATRAAASAEMKTQQGTHPVKVPKSKRNADLRNNAAAEQHLIEESSLTPTGVVSAARPLVVAPADTPHKRDVGGANSAAARAVAALVRGLPNAKQVP